MALPPPSKVKFTPATMLREPPEARDSCQPSRIATREAEHAVPTLKASPCIPNVYDSRPATTLSSVPVAIHAPMAS